MKPRLAPAIILLTAVLGLAGCSSAEEEPPAVQPTPVASSSVAPSPEASEETTAPVSEAAPATYTATVTTSEAPAPSSSTSQEAPRGGAIPGDASRVDRFVGTDAVSIGLIQTPSGNILCDIYPDQVTCVILSWMTDLPYGRQNIVGDIWHPINAITLTNGVVKMQGLGEPNYSVLYENQYQGEIRAPRSSGTANPFISAIMPAPPGRRA